MYSWNLLFFLVFLLKSDLDLDLAIDLDHCLWSWSSLNDLDLYLDDLWSRSKNKWSFTALNETISPFQKKVSFVWNLAQNLWWEAGCPLVSTEYRVGLNSLFWVSERNCWNAFPKSDTIVGQFSKPLILIVAKPVSEWQFSESGFC